MYFIIIQIKKQESGGKSARIVLSYTLTINFVHDGGTPFSFSFFVFVPAEVAIQHIYVRFFFFFISYTYTVPYLCVYIAQVHT